MTYHQYTAADLESPLDAALYYAGLDWPVFPLHTPDGQGGCSCGNPQCDDQGKHPRTRNGFKDATTDEATIRRWWTKWPNANVGIATGAARLLVIDVDSRKGGDETLADLIKQYGPLPETVEAITGGGGRHILFEDTEGGVRGGVDKLGPGLDVKAAGGYIVAPPSLHVSGQRYEWEASSHPEEVAVAPPSPWLLRKLTRGSSSHDVSNNGAEPVAGEGQRNDTLASLAGAMRVRGMSEEAITAALLEENKKRCKPPLLKEEVLRIAKSISSYPPGEVPLFIAPLKNSGNHRGALNQVNQGNRPNQGTQGFALTPLADLLAEPAEEFGYVVDSLLIAGGVSILAAKPKVGKSTLARNIGLAVARGEPFFDHPTHQGPVIYLALEEKRSKVAEHFALMGATDEPIVIHVGSAPKDALAELTAAIEQHGAVLAIIDPLFKLVRFRDGNDYTEVSGALEPLIALARNSGCHLLCVHHLGKGERDGGDAVLGSTALFGAVDTLLKMKRSGSAARTIEAIQRYGDDLPETVVHLDPQTGIVKAAGDVAVLRLEEAGQAILDALGEETLTEGDIRERAKGNESLLAKALRELVARGLVTRTGGGKKNDAYYYTVSKREGIG